MCTCNAGYTGAQCASCSQGYREEGSACVPARGPCGNQIIDYHEECDGAADAMCPGRCSAHCACPALAPGDTLQLHMIDVGQGDAILIISPDGFAMLVDAGHESQFERIHDYLDSVGLDELDYTLVSHMHSDHVGAMDLILKNGPGIVASFDHGGSYSTSEYQQYDLQADGRRRAVAVDDLIDLGPQVQAQVLHSGGGGDSENDSSVVLKISYGNTSLLLGGDCETGCEGTFNPGPTDVYKVHHHGSDTSSSSALVSRMQPGLALISVGENSFGHPDQWTIARLTNVGAAVARTDLDGDIVVHCDGTRCWIQ